MDTARHNASRSTKEIAMTNKHAADAGGFRRGQRVLRVGKPPRLVVYVDESNVAYLDNGGVFVPGDAPNMVIDHNGVWERQTRRNGKDDAIVLALSNDFRTVVYYLYGKSGVFFDTPLHFKEAYPEVVWPETEAPPQCPVNIDDIVWVRWDGGEWLCRVADCNEKAVLLVGPNFQRLIPWGDAEFRILNCSALLPITS
jgi:hypothetical protein